MVTNYQLIVFSNYSSTKFTVEFYASVVFQSNWPVNKFMVRPQQNYVATGR